MFALVALEESSPVVQPPPIAPAPVVAGREAIVTVQEVLDS